MLSIERLVGVRIMYSEKKLILSFANNKGTDQTALMLSLICTFVIPYLKSMISKFATNKVSRFQIVSVAEKAGSDMH